MVGSMDVDAWGVTFGTARRGLGGAPARSGIRQFERMTDHE